MICRLGLLGYAMAGSFGRAVGTGEGSAAGGGEASAAAVGSGGAGLSVGAGAGSAAVGCGVLLSYSARSSCEVRREEKRSTPYPIRRASPKTSRPENARKRVSRPQRRLFLCFLYRYRKGHYNKDRKVVKIQNRRLHT